MQNAEQSTAQNAAKADCLLHILALRFYAKITKGNLPSGSVLLFFAEAHGARKHSFQEKQRQAEPERQKIRGKLAASPKPRQNRSEKPR